MMTNELRDVDLAWAAGFWDGEGCVYLDRRSDNYSLQISQSGDEAVELLERFLRSVGVQGKVYDGWRRDPSHKPAFKVHIRGEQARLAIERCWPYLSRTKRAQAQAAIDAHAERQAAYVHHMAAKTHCPQGHPYDEENTQYNKRGARRCRSCRRERYYAQTEGSVTRRKSKFKPAARVERRQDEIEKESKA